MSAVIFSTLVGSTLLANAALLQPRTITSQAVCQSGFEWMDNAEHTSPCMVAAELNGICNNNQWTVPALNSSVNYNNPDTSAGTVSLCTCSWASYNLISACTACQGFPEKIPSWTVYSSQCGSDKTPSTYFPPSINIPEGTTIPFWAGEDPTSQWTNQIFNAAQAQAIANQSHADLSNPAPPSHKKSTNVGAIVGGVIGGLAVIAIASAIAFYILRKHRNSGAGAPVSLIEKPHHMRSISDVTTTSGMQGYTTLSSTPMNPPTSPTILTHQSSIRSVPYFSSVVASTVPQGTSSPPPLPTSSPPPRNREDVIEPFTLPPSNVSDRKQANGAFPVYDPPTAPPPAAIRNMEINRPATPTQRARYNPPTYSESTTGGPSNSSSPPPTRALHRGKQGSTDTLPSITSHGQRQTPAHSPNSSASGMGNIVGQMGIANSGTSTPPTHGRQVSGSRDEKRQPTEDSFSARDLA